MYDFVRYRIGDGCYIWDSDVEHGTLDVVLQICHIVHGLYELPAHVSCDRSIQCLLDSTIVDEHSPFLHCFVPRTITLLVIVVDNCVKWVSGSVACLEIF